MILGVLTYLIVTQREAPSPPYSIVTYRTLTNRRAPGSPVLYFPSLEELKFWQTSYEYIKNIILWEYHIIYPHKIIQIFPPELSILKKYFENSGLHLFLNFTLFSRFVTSSDLKSAWQFKLQFYKWFAYFLEIVKFDRK